MDTTFKTNEGVFTYRVGAIILNGTKALLTRDKKHGHARHGRRKGAFRGILGADYAKGNFRGNRNKSGA